MSVILVLAVLKASLLLAVGLVTVRVACRARAAVRHVVLTAAFLGLLVLPVGIALLPDVPVPMPMMRPELAAGALLASFDQERVVTVSENAARPAVAVPGPPPGPSAERVFWLVWGIGAFAAVLPLVAGLVQLRRIRRRGRPWPEGQALVDEVGRDHGRGRFVHVLIDDDAPGPMTCGVVRPVIVFPPDVLQWNRPDLHRAMRHELEHVRRADCLVDAIARLTCAIYWFHPFAWVAWRQLRLEAERACDDAVLNGSEAIAYAEQLVSFAARVSTARTPLLAMAGGRDLKRRVVSVLDRAQRRGRAGGAWTTATLVAGFAFASAIAPLCAAWQVSAAAPVSFEIASVKENTSGDPFGGGDRKNSRLFPGGRITATNYTLRELILWAYRDEITRSQLSGLADWMDQRRFDIEARAADGVIAPGELDHARAEVMDRMLQSLLADRFKLRVRREQQVGDLHVLALAPGGPKMPRSKAAEACLTAEHPGGLTIAIPAVGCHMFSRIGRTGMEGPALDTADIASGLRLYLGRPIVDQVKLPDLFEVAVRWRPDTPSRDGGAGGEPEGGEDDPDMYTALREQLGLKLEIRRAPIDTLVVESAELPAAN